MTLLKRLINNHLVIIIFLFTLNLKAQLRDEVLAIEEVIREAYIDGVFNEGNVRNIELGFSKNFQMLALDEEGQEMTFDRDYFIQRVKQMKAEGKFPPAKDQMVHFKILRTDVEGNSASVKLNFYRGSKLAYIDLLHLIKVKRNWLIVHKVFKSTEQSSK